MPSGKKDIYGNKSKALYKAGTIASERAAIANRDPARARAAMKAVAREGTTNASGGRPAAKMPAKPAAPKAKPAQVIRTTQLYKPTPTKKK
jgi:hypothetical protein